MQSQKTLTGSFDAGKIKGILLIVLVLALTLVHSGCVGLAGSNTMPMLLSNPAPSNVSPSSATISWTTNVLATSQVEYGTTISYGLKTALDPALVTNHAQTLTALAASTTYHYRVHSRDANSLETVSKDFALTTPATAGTPPPSVSITAPAQGATVSGTIIVSTSVSSNTVSVQFRVDGINTGSPVTAAPFSYSLNTTTLSNGSHAISAVASNASAQTATASVTVSVNNLAPPTPPTPPTISISSPTSGATVSSTITVSTSVSSNTVSVQFRVDGINTGSPVTAAPFSYSLNTTTLSNGSHAISAVASNASAQTATASVTVSVNNLAPPTPPTPPTISISSPTSGATVSGTVIVSTSVSSNTVSVQFRVDGINTGSPVTAAPFSYSLNTTTLSNGSHAISAVASNASAQTATASVTINVLNSTPSGGPIPASPGWYDVPNTQLQNVCPPSTSSYDFSFYCQYVIRDWSGGIGDTKRNRLIIWGGGHSAYYGNEVYAFDLNTLKLTRLNNPSPIASGTGCPTTLSDGNPNSRHTYNGLAYIAHADRMFVFSGAPANTDGCFTNDTWTLDLGTLQWKRMDPTSGGPPKGILAASVAAYDPNSKLVYLDDRYDFWSYNYDTNTYTHLDTSADNGLYTTAVVDPKRKLWIVIGGGTVAIRNIAPGAAVSQQTWSTSGCSALASSSSPGLAYDPVQDRIVGWPNFGNTVYIFNPDTQSCTSQTFSGGPPDSAHESAAPNSTGTFGRFQYFPAFGVFAVVNDWNIDAHTLRLTAGSTPPPSGPVISGVTASSITTSGATISWTTNVPATTQVDYGTSTAYGLSTTLDLTLSTSHAQSLTGLAAGTLYHYRLRSRDASNVETISGDFAFSTNTAVTTPPPSVSLTAPVSGAVLSGTVTVSAVASGTVGIVGVQFLLDGANFAAEVTSAPYSLSWDTTTAVNGSHVLTARARDAAGNMATSTAVTLTVSNVASTGNADADYAARCATPGVVRCFKPEDPVFVQAHLDPGDGGVYRGAVDTAIKASGIGSLKFTVPSNTGTSPAGELWLDFTEDLSTQFGSGDEFWLQWRQRFSLEFVNNAWSGNGWKQIIVGEGDRPGFTANSCTDMHLVVENTYLRNVPQMYHSCGYKDGQYETLERFNNSIGTYDIQPDLGCSHTAITVPPCVIYKPDQWMTFMLHVKVGTWYTNNHVYKHDSTVELYVAYEGQPSTLVMNFKRVGNAACDAQQASIPSGCTTGYDLANSNPSAAKYGKLWLLPYMTGHTPQTLPTGYTWYDQIIISQQKIPDPKF